jgi:hypothetical protein
MAYVPLPIVDARIDDLCLDLDNYRIPTRRDNEAAALRYLFESEDVMEAALLILRDGYFDNEVPIVIDDGRRGYVVLEGNRRVSALKALHDPTIAPSHATEIRGLLKRYATEAHNLPFEIRVLVAPDRPAARPHIARLHTGLSKRRWSRDQQATFYYSLLDGNTTVDDIKSDYPGVEVARFIKMAVVRRFLAAVPFEDHSLRDYVAGDSLRMSSFEYAFRRVGIADAIGLKFDSDGLLLPRSSSPEKIAAGLVSSQRAALEYLVGEFRANRLNTRSKEFKESAEEHQDLVRRLRGRDKSAATASEDSSNAESTSEDSSNAESDAAATPSTDGSSQAADPPASRGPNHPDTKSRLDFSDVDYGSTPVTLQRRYHELRRINITDFPISTAILLRAVFEMTIKWHFEANPTPASGQLRDTFKSVVTAYGKKPKALNGAIRAIESGRQPGSIEWFNAAAHDFNAGIPATDVRQAWERVNPVLRHLLRSRVLEAR